MEPARTRHSHSTRVEIFHKNVSILNVIFKILHFLYTEYRYILNPIYADIFQFAFKYTRFCKMVLILLFIVTIQNASYLVL